MADVEGEMLSDSGDEMEESADGGEEGVTASCGAKQPNVYLPGQEIKADEELVCDESAYIVYHHAQTGAPCLSFDLLRDGLGDQREEFPLTLYAVAGTQAERAHTNQIIVMKMSNIQKTQKNKDNEEENESDESSDEDEDEKPELDTAMIKHSGAVNRLRCTRIGERHIAATWSELGTVNIWDLTRPLEAVNDSNVMSTYTRQQESPLPVFKFSGHQAEGYAIDWSPTVPGKLATGDCTKSIHLWTVKDGGGWHVDQRPYSGHTASVEDIQWSPNEDNVFASCSVDKSIRVWDARAAPSKACMLTSQEAHDRDINVISWNKKEPFIISGGDDGIIKVWDLRQFQHGKPVALFKHHTGPITSVEWHSVDSTVFAASGSDDQLTLWDLAMERDSEAASASADDEEQVAVPPQLLFIHQGQTDIKELHWHPQISGLIVSTAHSGFNVFRTISV